MTLHAMADGPLRGPDAKWNLATVTHGDHESETVGIMVQYTDGWCICDRGADYGMELIHIDHLRPWISVESVCIENGRLKIQPLGQ